MSWGERSCKNKPCPIPDKCTYETCDVDCPRYQWDGKTKPDSVSKNRLNNTCNENANANLEDFIRQQRMEENKKKSIPKNWRKIVKKGTLKRKK